ncbi:hypothetical protein Ciccas_009891, partial [Cichlidogyrus casuarinus]
SVVAYSNTFIHVVISVKRWQAICRPLTHRATLKEATIVILMVWFGASLLATHRAVEMNLRLPDYNQSDANDTYATCQANEHNYQGLVTMTRFVFFWVLPFLWMAFAYAMISHRLWFAEIPGYKSGLRHVLILNWKYRRFQFTEDVDVCRGQLRPY